MAGKKKTVSKSPEPKETPQDVVDSTGVTVSNPVKANPSAESSKKRKFSMSQRAGVVMPVSRILHHLRKGHHAKIIQRGAAIYASAVLEYLVAETLEMAGEACKENKKKRINPRHICIAIRQDEEMNELCRNVTISEGGVVPFIHNSLLPKPTATKVLTVTSPKMQVSDSYEA